MVPRRPSSLLTPAALACALLAGCGGAKDKPGSQVRAALARFDAVQASGDSRTACRELVAVDEQGRIEVPGEAESQDKGSSAGTEEARREAEAKREAEAAADGGRDAAPAAGASPSRDVLACERAFTQAARSRKALRDVELVVKQVTIKGDTATAATQTRLTRADGSKLRQDATRRLVRRDGRWRVVLTEE